jgi:lipoyl(octanoyl) transferase
VSESGQVAWLIEDRLIEYPDAIAFMEKRVDEIRGGTAPETVWLVEHPPLYTAGTSAKAGDLLIPDRFPVYESGRGGQFTYHGPGQRVAYVMLNVKARGGDVRRFVHDLEEWVIRTLARFNITALRREGRVGIWVIEGKREDKIGAIGIRLRHGISFHGISLNLEPDLSHFTGIVPCGISESATSPYGVTSLAKLGIMISMPELDMAMKGAFEEVFE